MAIAPFNAGALAVTATAGATIWPALPAATAVNDIAFLAVMTNASNAFPAITGWTKVTGSEVTNANESSCLYWRRLTGSGDAPAAFTIASGTALGNTNGLYGRIWVYRGCITTGTPYEAYSLTGPTTSSTPQSASITSTGINRLAVVILMADDDNSFSSGMPPTGWTEFGGIASSATGGDHMDDTIYKALPTATTQAAVTVGTMSAADYWVTHSLALIPAPDPAFDQDAYRFRNDDGSETTATWKAALNTPVTGQALDTNFRLRIAFEETAGGNPPALDFAIAYRRKPSGGAFGSWIQVEDAGIGTHIELAASPNFTDGTTTRQIWGSATGFVAGRIMEAYTNLTADLGALGTTEYEFNMKAVSANGAANGDEYEFRIITTSSGAIDSYTNMPSLTVGSGLSKVSATRILLWADVGRVSNTRILLNSVKARVSGTRILLNSVKERVSGSRILLNAVKARVSGTRTLLNAVAARVSGTRILLNTNRERVSGSRILLNSVRQRVNQTRTFLNAIAARVSATRILLNGVGGRVSATRILLNSVKERVSGSRILLNSVRVRTSSTRILLAKISERAAGSRVLLWRELARVSGTRTLLAAIAERVPATRVLLYGVKERVAGTRTLLYAVIQVGRVTAERTLLWAVPGRVFATRVLLAQLRQRVSGERTLLAAIRARAAATRGLLYDVLALARVASTLTLLYGTRERIAAELDLLNALRIRVSDTRALLYRVLVRTSATRLLLWDVFAIARAAKELLLRWRLGRLPFRFPRPVGAIARKFGFSEVSDDDRAATIERTRNESDIRRKT